MSGARPVRLRPTVSSAPEAAVTSTLALHPAEVSVPEKSLKRRMSLATRLAILTAALAVALVLAATEIALSWSQRSRLDDFREESVGLANTLATFLMRVAPNGNPGAIQLGLAGWSRHRITETRADVFEKSGNLLVPVASSDTSLSGSGDENDRDALKGDTMVV